MTPNEAGCSIILAFVTVLWPHLNPSSICVEGMLAYMHKNNQTLSELLEQSHNQCW